MHTVRLQYFYREYKQLKKKIREPFQLIESNDQTMQFLWIIDRACNFIQESINNLQVFYVRNLFDFSDGIKMENRE